MAKDKAGFTNGDIASSPVFSDSNIKSNFSLFCPSHTYIYPCGHPLYL